MSLTSIIIPTYNPGPENVLQMQARLASQLFTNWELVIIDSSSTDGSLSLWEARRTIVIPQANFDHGGTRNQAAHAANGQILIFMTQDAIPADDACLAELVEPILNGEAQACYGRQLPRPDADPMEVFARTFNYTAESRIKSLHDKDELGIKTFFFSNVCSAVSTPHFWQVGGFPTRTVLNEDMMLAAKLIMSGHLIKYVADARVVHSHDYGLKQHFQRYFDIGASMPQLRTALDGVDLGGEGLHFVLGQARYVLGLGHWWLVPKVFAEAATKYVGFELGRRERFLPRELKRHLSMHGHFWI